MPGGRAHPIINATKQRLRIEENNALAEGGGRRWRRSTDTCILNYSRSLNTPYEIHLSVYFLANEYSSMSSHKHAENANDKVTGKRERSRAYQLQFSISTIGCVLTDMLLRIIVCLKDVIIHQ